MAKGGGCDPEVGEKRGGVGGGPWTVDSVQLMGNRLTTRLLSATSFAQLA